MISHIFEHLITVRISFIRGILALVFCVSDFVCVYLTVCIDVLTLRCFVLYYLTVSPSRAVYNYCVNYCFIYQPISPLSLTCLHLDIDRFLSLHYSHNHVVYAIPALQSFPGFPSVPRR